MGVPSNRSATHTPRFTGEVFAVPEGTPVFADEPLVERGEGPVDRSGGGDDASCRAGLEARNPGVDRRAEHGRRTAIGIPMVVESPPHHGFRNRTRVAADNRAAWTLEGDDPEISPGEPGELLCNGTHNATSIEMSLLFAEKLTDGEHAT